jgi:hypothetical protein
VTQASVVVQSVADLVEGEVDRYHALWIADGRLSYRSGRLVGLSHPVTLVSGLQACADPELLLLPSKRVAAVWAEEQTPNRGIVPGEWNLRYTADVNVAPRWFTEDQGIGALHPDRNPRTVARADTVLVTWERDSPTQIAYAFLSPLDIFPTVRLLTNYPYAAARPCVAAGIENEYWIAWTAETPVGGDIWVSRVTRSGADTPTSVRQGGPDERNCDIAVDGDGRLHVVWQEGASGGAIFTAHRLTDGTFSPAIMVSPAGTVGEYPHIYFDGPSTPCFAWRNAGTGALEVNKLLGTRPFAPIPVIAGTYNARQDRVSPAQAITPGGAIVSVFLAPDPIRAVANLWVGTRGEFLSGNDTPAITGQNTPVAQPMRFSVQAAPNPFNATIGLTAFLPEAATVRAEILSIGGRSVRSFDDRAEYADTRKFVWDGSDGEGNRVASGVYFVQWHVLFDSGGRVKHVTRIALIR